MNLKSVNSILSLLLVCFSWLIGTGPIAQAEDVRVLFLGDQGHHKPSALSKVITPQLAPYGIALTYTEDISKLSKDELAKYDGLMIYANIDVLPAEQEKALLEFVANGGGLIPVHCASWCFRNSKAYVELVGGQFKRHGTGTFRTKLAQPDHPILQGFSGFESWDETYIHSQHNESNRIVLEVRSELDQDPGVKAEPWTWVRTHAAGRVFYTAWGHDQRTWEQVGFQNLLARGILWACQADLSNVPKYNDPNSFPVPKMTELRKDVAPFEYEDVGPKIPNYVAGDRWGVQGKVQTLMQKPLPPEESIKHFVVPEGFHLELYASEPSFQGKPIAMNWDHRGRMWVCETIDYPNDLMPPEQGRDRIRICEDTNGDGVADKFTVFAENISIPTSIEFCQDGVIVQAGTETIFMRDTNGDDVADEREVLISGWAMGDTHGGVSNFQYGLDNRFWAMQGYNDSQPKYFGGTHSRMRQGPFAFSVGKNGKNPAVTDFEFVRSTNNNSWGLGISEEGLIFCSTANRFPSFFVPIPNRYYERVRGWTPGLVADPIAADHYFSPITDKIRQVDHHGGYTAGAGHGIYTARVYPESWWNRTAFVCGPTGHLIGTFVLNRYGSTFRTKNTFNLVASDDEWSAPIMAEVGPDGNVWILDWYNYIIQHNPTPQGFQTGKGNAYESDLRDKKHGRVYRLVYDGKEGMPQSGTMPKLEPEDPQTLIAALSHTNRLWRRHAQRLLVERGKLDVVPQLIKLMDNREVDSTGNTAAVNHALWTLHGLGALKAAQGDAFQAVVSALKHPAPGARRNAALVLPSSTESAQAIVQAGLLNDQDAQVRLGALMALADMPSSSAVGEALAELSNLPAVYKDQFFKDGLICASASHAFDFLTNVLAHKPVEGQAKTQDIAQVTEILSEHLARSGMDEAALTAIFKAASSADATLVQSVVSGLSAGWPSGSRPTITPEFDSLIADLLQRLPMEARGPLVKMTSEWGSTKIAEFGKQISGSLLEKVEDESLKAADRIAAAKELISFLGNNSEAVTSLLALVSPQMPPEVASGVLRSLASSAAENVGSELLEAWDSLTPALRSDAIAVLLARPSSTSLLLKALSDGSIGITDLSLEQRQSLLDHPSPEIRKQADQLLKASGGVANSDRQEVLETYAVATHTDGDPVVGKELYVKNCAQCHKHSGQGNEIGPDLTGMAVHPKEELLIHILDPNRSVEGNFRRYTVVTAAGQVLTGMMAGESQSSIELIDAEGKRRPISREDIESLKSTNLSLMPVGFEQQLDIKGMTDLLEFLTTKGKFVPLPFAGVATAISTKPMFGGREGDVDVLMFESFEPRVVEGIAFQLENTDNGKKPNIILLNSPRAPQSVSGKMPKQVSLPCSMNVKTFHILGAISGWGFPAGATQTTSVIFRINYQDGTSEDHELKNGVHFADYNGRHDVPESKFAFQLKNSQVRYLTISPKRTDPIATVDIVKGDDRSAPIFVAITAERPE